MGVSVWRRVALVEQEVLQGPQPREQVVQFEPLLWLPGIRTFSGLQSPVSDGGPFS